ncbi:MAG: RNA polymerase sigma factor [Limisphaerales bacterium]
MVELDELVAAYRHARTFPKRLDAAERIAWAISPPLLAFLRGQVRSGPAEDLLQSTLTAVFRQLDTCRATTGRSFLGWCYGIASNKVKDHWRSKHVTRTLVLDPDELREVMHAATAEDPITPGERTDLEYALELLRQSKPPCVEALWNHYVLEMSYQDLAEIEGRSPDAVRVEISRCLKLAQSLIAKYP